VALPRRNRRRDRPRYPAGRCAARAGGGRPRVHAPSTSRRGRQEGDLDDGAGRLSDPAGDGSVRALPRTTDPYDVEPMTFESAMSHTQAENEEPNTGGDTA